MRRALRTAWTWSWLVTVPVVVLFLAWTAATWRHVRLSAQDPLAGPWQEELHEAGSEAARQLLRQLALRLRPGDLTDVPAELQLRTIQLFVDDEQRDRLDHDLPYSGFEWAKALLAYGDGLHKVELRYRGETITHWGFDKKSMRVKTATNDLFAGLREFNLLVPRFPATGDNHLAYRLAKRFGLITPRCELVDVFVNGRLLGVMEFTERLDEGTLRDHDRMPGDLYAGELRLRDARRGTANRLFDLPWTWEKLAENNHYPVGSRAPLEALCAVLAEPMSEAAHARLGELLDLDAWGRFGAFELLAQTQAYDDSGNWRLFWDPWRRRFEPVVWDPAGWAAQLGEAGAPVRLDVAPSRLHAWLLANGTFLAARQRALAGFFAAGEAPFLAEVATTVAKLRHALHHDPNLRPADETVVMAAVDGLPGMLQRVFAAVRAEHLDGAGDVAWASAGPGLVRVEVQGRDVGEAIELVGTQPLAPGQTVHVQVPHADGMHRLDVTSTVTLRDATLRVPLRLLGQLAPLADGGTAAAVRRVLPTTFELDVTPPLPPLRSVVVERSGRRVEARAAEALPRHVHDGLFAAVAVPRAAQPERWSGQVVVEGVRTVAADVHIAPGTTIRLRPKASLLFSGQVIAEGTAEAPIRFVPAVADQDPWGTVLLDGAACSGSRLRHCEFRGGSGYKVPLAECCSMVSVHNCAQVRISDCWFGENHQYDDLVHVMYADVVFERVTLDGARADALDCDLSTVVIRDSTFVRSVNDGVDLMTSRALIEGCRFEANGDKGVSIGEGSRLVVLRSTFDGCNKAMEAKDGSLAHALHIEVRRCTKAANAYKKNWRYDAGGVLVLQRSVVVDNAALPTADTWSRIDLVDCTVVGALDAEYEQEYVDGKPSVRMQNRARTVACDRSPTLQAPGELPFPAELETLRDLAGEAWRAATGTRRGVTP